MLNVWKIGGTGHFVVNGGMEVSNGMEVLH
jgi:hypothetical protein